MKFIVVESNILFVLVEGSTVGIGTFEILAQGTNATNTTSVNGVKIFQLRILMSHFLLHIKNYQIMKLNQNCQN
jgi:hypothetical protein